MTLKGLASTTHANSSSGFITAPTCPICGKPNKCAVSRDGTAALCWNVRSSRQSKTGNWYHWLDRNDSSFPPRNNPGSFSPSTYKPKKPVEGKPYLTFASHSNKCREDLLRWAEKRSVTVDSLVALGAIPYRNSIEFPERETESPHDVCGFNERYWDPIKHADGSEQRFKFKGKRGYQFTNEWFASKIPMVVIVEGFADVASVLDAGLIAIGRYTRAADLKPLAAMLKALNAETRIVVLCENDEPKPGQESPLEQVKRCASDLQNELGRIVLVATPPPEHKDMNDWWASLTDGMGHEIDEKERTAIGWGICDILLERASAQIVGENIEYAKKQAYYIELQAEIHRHNRHEQNVDMDYDVSNSCAYQHIFTKASSDGKEVKIMGGKLACKRWKCWACRHRLLYPTWSITLIEGFAACVGVYTRWLTDAQASRMKLDQQSCGGTWALIRQTEPNEDGGTGGEKGFFGIATRPIRGHCYYYDFVGSDKSFDWFCKSIEEIVKSIDGTDSRPITTSRNIKKTEKPSRDDWVSKVEKILDSDQPVFCGFVTDEKAAEIRSDAYKSIRVIGRETIDFITIDVECSKSFVICSEEFEGCEPVRSETFRETSSLILDPNSTIKASSRWYAKKTKGWERSGINKGPSDVRAVAKRRKLQSSDLDFGVLESMVDSSQIKVPQIDRDEILVEIEHDP